MMNRCDSLDDIDFASKLMASEILPASVGIGPLCRLNLSHKFLNVPCNIYATAGQDPLAKLKYYCQCNPFSALNRTHLDRYFTLVDLSSMKISDDDKNLFNQVGELLNVEYFAPAARLVGIEPNPGPKVKASKAHTPRHNTNVQMNVAKKQQGVLIRQINNVTDIRTNVRPTSQRTTRIVQRERLNLNVTVANAANTSGYSDLNPGNSFMFPWLYSQALSWGKYRFLKCRFIYRPLVSAFNTQGSATKVMLVFNYDVTDSPVTTINAASTFAWSAQCMSYEECYLNLDCHQLNTQDSKYVRYLNIPLGQDPKTYDGGRLSWVTSNGTATATVGEIYVDYEIELINPVNQTTNVSYSNNVVQSYYLATTGNLATGTGYNLFKSADTYNAISTPPIPFFSGAATGVFTAVIPGTFSITFSGTMTNSNNAITYSRLLLYINNAIYADTTNSGTGTLWGMGNLSQIMTVTAVFAIGDTFFLESTGTFGSGTTQVLRGFLSVVGLN